LAHDAHLVHDTHERALLRPVGFTIYWLDYKWAGTNPFRWHLWSLSVHILNSALLFVRELKLGRFASTVCALIFAIHASRAGPVSWTDARFDLLATACVLASLILLNRYLDTGRRLHFLLAMVPAVLALFVKESAFCLPFLVPCLIPFKEKSARRGVIQSAIVLFVICITGFLYRWWMLGGIGGYRTPAGRPMIADFGPLQISKVLLLRLWAILNFPINWSVEPGWWLKIGMVLVVIAMAVICFVSSGNRSRLAAAAGFVVASTLPVGHLLLIGPDLGGARFLYLPVVGFALFFGLLFESLRSGRCQVLLAAGLLFFHEAALQHSLRMWREVPALARAACMDFGKELASDSRSAIVSDLPITLHGVYFLANGFPQCVAFNSGQDAGRIHVARQDPLSPQENVRRFTWEEKRFRLIEVAPEAEPLASPTSSGKAPKRRRSRSPASPR